MKERMDRKSGSKRKSMQREGEREKDRQNGYDDRFTILPENSVKRSQQKKKRTQE